MSFSSSYNTNKDEAQSPAYLLMKRNPRTLLPCIALLNNSKVEEATCRKLSYTKQYYNEHSKDLPSLSLNGTVRIRHNNNWSLKGAIIRKCEEPRSDKVLTEKGTVLRCNHCQLLKTKEPFEKHYEIDYASIVINDANQSQTVPSMTNIAEELVLPEQDQVMDVKLNLQANGTYRLSIVDIAL